MEIHLVTVKIRIVGCTDAFIEAESAVRQNLGSVTHNGKFMQRRLTVEQDDIFIHHMPFNQIAKLKENVFC
jgi:hypothetical protein